MKFKSSFYLPLKNLKSAEYKLLNVSINLDHGQTIDHDPEYSVVIPDHVFNELADTENQFSTNPDIYDPVMDHRGCFSNKTISYRFIKTQTSTSVESLKIYIHYLTEYILSKYEDPAHKPIKMIFIRFNHNKNHETNNWCGAYRGESINQIFQYFIGYKIRKRIDSNSMFAGESYKYITRIEYHSKNSTTSKRDTGLKEDPDLSLPLNSHNESIKSFESKFSIIEWSEERENFCMRIQKTFEKVNQELDHFLSKIDNEKIDLLIKENNLKFLLE